MGKKKKYFEDLKIHKLLFSEIKKLENEASNCYEY